MFPDHVTWRWRSSVGEIAVDRTRFLVDSGRQTRDDELIVDYADRPECRAAEVYRKRRSGGVILCLIPEPVSGEQATGRRRRSCCARGRITRFGLDECVAKGGGGVHVVIKSRARQKFRRLTTHRSFTTVRIRTKRSIRFPRPLPRGARLLDLYVPTKQYVVVGHFCHAAAGCPPFGKLIRTYRTAIVNIVIIVVFRLSDVRKVFTATRHSTDRQPYTL